MGQEENANSKLEIWQSTSDQRIKRRYGQLYARFTKYGVRVEQRLHETTLSAAKVSCNLIEDALSANRHLSHDEIRRKIRSIFGKDATPQDKPILIGEYWPRFIEFRKAGSKIHKCTPWRPKTLLEYESFWTRSFEPFWASKLPAEIETDWEAFIQAEYARSKKGAGLNFDCHTKYMQAFGSYLVLKGALPKKPLIWSPDPVPINGVDDSDGAEDGKGIVIPDDKVRAMIESTKASFGLFIRCGSFMGMRSSEITQMKKNRIDLEKGVIRLRPQDVKTGSKTKKGRIIPIHKEVMPLLLEQIKRSGSSTVLFPNQRDSARPMDPTGFYGQWGKLMDAIGMPEVTPHDMRHSYATKIFSNPNVNPVLACKALGMGMQMAEKVYIHFDEKHLKIVSSNFNFDTEKKRGMKCCWDRAGTF